jgi:hypothetical protein
LSFLRACGSYEDDPLRGKGGTPFTTAIGNEEEGNIRPKGFAG